MSKILGPILAMDWERGVFHTTTDGINKVPYTRKQILECQHFLDNPGYIAVCEAAHLAPKPTSRRDRGAQVFTQEELEQFNIRVRELEAKQLTSSARLTKRVLEEMGYKGKPQDSVLAWWKYCNTVPKIRDMVKEFKPITERDQRRNKKLNESRTDASHRVDGLAGIKYLDDDQDIINCRRMLEWGVECGRISPDNAEQFKIKINKKKGILNSFRIEAKRAVMPLYVLAVDADGVYRCDARGNPIGIRTALGGIGQHHHFHGGKGSKGSARAKTRNRLKTHENRYRKENKVRKIKGQSFPAPIPSVRKHHEKMNKELVRVFRDYSRSHSLCHFVGVH